MHDSEDGGQQKILEFYTYMGRWFNKFLVLMMCLLFKVILRAARLESMTLIRAKNFKSDTVTGLVNITIFLFLLYLQNDSVSWFYYSLFCSYYVYIQLVSQCCYLHYEVHNNNIVMRRISLTDLIPSSLIQWEMHFFLHIFEVAVCRLLGT